jgi:hypothetical protein
MSASIGKKSGSVVAHARLARRAATFVTTSRWLFRQDQLALAGEP